MNPKTFRNDPAFPCDHELEGMTKREYFAAMALQGLLVNENGLLYAVKDAVVAADLLIEALNKSEEGQP